ncbi:TIGR02611 family protein [Streptomyces somaliensis DSM 40738]|uniref:TIGR02611 family protein n=1 Tax=Streptomyces somaliensis (strain ATCC 33201 / DSM 40738 / JCM 12659 / KCTC 9044 / NCTC 11332 / NRRL B-12077 / IP 733) TaxID=1134445 RepID=A0AA44DCT4_STRE0|nr:TIGR02611 family protein [Streptomyces somaliensis]MCQ0021992.1 TIGR02611 family protein [Streptomyces somaliensis DSM 40738]NKY14372.1 TIGR02611 family protein [Streptomyces somaliensis DSM 40738]
MDAESDERGGAARCAAETPAAGDVTRRTDGRPLGSRAPAFVRARRPLHLSWQVGVFLIGLTVVGVGVVMLPLPGPGWFVIFAGMAIWATEFVWAQLVLRWTKRKVTEAAQRALDPRVRRRNLALTVAGLVIAGVLIGIYVWKFGLVVPWKADR